VLLIALILLLITVGLDAGVETPAAPSAQSARPRLTIATMNPLHVVGNGFKSRERVAVSVGPRRREATADASGRFTVRFGRAMCTSGTITAVGSKGSRAVAHLPKTLCAEP
jgi:hypothetical protein